MATNTILNSKYTQEQLAEVPGLFQAAQNILSTARFGGPDPYNIVNKLINTAMSNPVEWVKSKLQSDIVSGYYGNNYTNLQNDIEYLKNKNVPIEEIRLLYDKSVEKAQTQIGTQISQRLTSNAKLDALFAVGLSFALPGIGSTIGAQLVAANVITNAAIANAVGTAMASTAIQMAQGASFEDALKNATVNAIIQTGAPSVATEINKLVKIPQVSDAITSAGASALKTAAAGGSAADIERNMIGAIAGSATSSAVEYGTEGNISAGRLAGATVGGAVTGGTEGAFTGLAGEYAGQKTAEEARLKESRSKMLASADGSTLSDSGTLGNVVVTGSRETPGITDTSIITPTGRISDREVMGAMRPRPISGTLSEVTVTAPRETPDITETSIVSPDSLPEVEVKGEREEEPQAQPEEESPVDEQGRYRPNLFIYGGVKPSTLPQTLGTSVEKVPSASTTTGTSVGLGGRGEIESKESGKKRKTVWNEESLRLKDALGL